MNILFVHNLSPWDARSGGGQKAHHEIAVALQERGHDVRALFIGPEPGDPGPRSPYPAEWVPEHPRLMNNVLRLRRATVELLERWKPDAAYLSSAESAGVAAGLPHAVGVVMTSHHFELPHLLSSAEWMRPLRALRRIRKLQRFYLERHVLRRAQRVTAVSEYGRTILLERRYLPEGSTVRVIPNGVHEHWFESDGPDEGATPRGDHALFVGRMDHQKGVDILLRAMAATPGSWSLRLVGEGWQRQEYEDLAEDLSLTERVAFLGHADKHDIKRQMREAAFIVVPSRAENYPLVLLEAMATGTPVLSTHVGGIPEMIDSGTSGLLVQPGDVAALAGALDRLATDAPFRDAFAGPALNVAKRHRWPNVAAEVEEELMAAAAEASGR